MMYCDTMMYSHVHIWDLWYSRKTADICLQLNATFGACQHWYVMEENKFMINVRLKQANVNKFKKLKL